MRSSVPLFVCSFCIVWATQEFSCSENSMQACRSALPSVMRAIRVSEFGAPEVLQLRKNVVVPQPSVTEVLIKVYAAGVNPVETYIRSGNYGTLPSLPFTPGNDAAGTVEAVGSKVKNFKVGDRVYTRSCTGAYAEYTTASEGSVYKLHDKMSFAQGAAIGVPYRTAHVALHSRAKARSSETVLIHGASGGVGIAAVQIAIAHGMTVLGTAGTDQGLELVKKQGAHHVFNHRTPGYTDKIMEVTGGQGVDVVLEMLANVNLGKDMSLVAVGGRIIVIGSRGNVEITPRNLLARNSMVIGLGRMGDDEVKDAYAGVQAGVALGWINPIVGKEYPLEKAIEAHVDVIEGNAKGKMVFLVQ
eukprot:m.307591 g.307591  ORF g.307591 m.307591 type:complete len:358 (+) comp42491_c0_seq1:67-1140(+)